MKREGFKLVGISIKTTNENGKSQEDMSKLWEKFISEKVMEKIPGKVSEEVFSVYTDYESDYKGKYTVILGAKVLNFDEVPNGMVSREFEPEIFKKFTAKGELPKAVGKEWGEIWQNDAELHRKYSYDYEVYGEKSKNMKDGEVDIFVAVKD